MKAKYTNNKKMRKVEQKLNRTRWDYAHAEYDWTNPFESWKVREQARRKMEKIEKRIIPKLERKIKKLEKRLDIASVYMLQYN